MIQAYIIVYNQLTWPRDIANRLSLIDGVEPVFVDNCSTYQPLLDWYKTACPYRIEHMDINYGHKAPWESGLIDRDKGKHFIVTDPDLDISSVPLDMVDYLIEALESFKCITKAGFSLKIDDLPEDALLLKDIMPLENIYRTKSVGKDKYYWALVDTTFALYERERGMKWGWYAAIRTKPPYEARHLPWYITNENLTEEYKQYLNTCSSKVSSVAREFRGKLNF